MKTFFAFIFLAWILPSIVNCAALHPRLQKEDQQTYDQETAAFKQKGYCRVYSGAKSKRTHVDQTPTCVDFCKDKGGDQGLSCKGAYDTIANQELGQGIDPDGNKFFMGQCVCGGDPIIKEVAETVAKALPAVAAIGCEILINSLGKVLEYGLDAIPGVGEISAGMSSSIRAAKTIAENGEQAASFASWFGDPCNKDHNPDVEKYTKNIDKIFDPLSSISDDVVPGYEFSLPAVLDGVPLLIFAAYLELDA